MFRNHCAPIIFSILVTQLASADYSECSFVNPIDENEFENLRFTDICFNPEKFLLMPDNICSNTKVHSLSAVFDIRLENGTYENKLGNFVIEKKYESPCDKTFNLSKANIRYDWNVEAGELIMTIPSHNISKSDFCIRLHKSEFLDMYILEPHICGSSKSVIDIYIRGVSVFFMLLSVCIYLFSYLPRYGSVHNKCCTCYIICKTLHFILRSINEVTLNLGILVPELLCAAIGLCGYYCVITTYIWLVVINYNVWQSFITFETTWEGSFSRFNKVVWISAIGFIAITLVLDTIYPADNNEVWTPKAPIITCWVNTYHWMAIAFLHGPILLLILCNITLSMLTGWHIYKENKNTRNDWSDSHIQKRSNNMENFQFLFRLLLFTGVFSIFEKFYNIFVILRVFKYASTDYAEPVISLQGVFFFAMTVFRHEVLDSLRQQFSVCRNRGI